MNSHETHNLTYESHSIPSNMILQKSVIGLMLPKRNMHVSSEDGGVKKEKI
jgi:hypothetical protein